MSLVTKCNPPGFDCVTIDFTKPNRALDNARKAFQGATNHDSTQAAVDKLLHCLPNNPGKRVMMVGHGHSGLINTGSGEVTGGQYTRISLGNMFIWQDQLDDLKNRISELTFFSCDTAALLNGPTLLARVAAKVGARVNGFTGLLFIDDHGNISCETNGKWVHADPGDPLPPQVPALRLFEILTMDMQLKDDGAIRILNISQISAFSYFESEDRKEGPRLYLEGAQAQTLASMVDFAEISEVSGAPLAIVTGVVEIQFKGDLPRRSFTIYNDRLLQDQLAPEAFYFASPEFSAALSEARLYRY
jgi:hypothetical protein